MPEERKVKAGPDRSEFLLNYVTLKMKPQFSSGTVVTT